MEKRDYFTLAFGIVIGIHFRDFFTSLFLVNGLHYLSLLGIITGLLGVIYLDKSFGRRDDGLCDRQLVGEKNFMEFTCDVCGVKTVKWHMCSNSTDIESGYTTYCDECYKKLGESDGVADAMNDV